ncbi:MAG: class I SAM-dependent methyltransferase [Propionibacteriales bacterium]|nr:class I SAM-dependent methyltransferase [Propionibacteriales bacterium]
MTTRDLWLAANWPFVADALPDAPARVLEIGCGSEGGFVPRLLQDGYSAVGIDPEAPAGPNYHQVEFERYDIDQPVDAIVACTALHHVGDLAEVLTKVADSLARGGGLAIVEWDWKRFDEATARWCFARLPTLSPESEPTWLQRARDEWAASHQPWESYLEAWAQEERLHTGQEMLHELDLRFNRAAVSETPYFFADLADTSQSDEQAAIDSGQLHATGMRYVGHRGPPAA